MTPRRLIIADSGLTGAVGHHLGYSQSVAEAAMRRGIAPLILAGRAFTGGVAGGAIPTLSTFDAQYQGQGRGGRMRQLVFGTASYLPEPLARLVPGPFHTLRRQLDRWATQDRFARELAATLREQGGRASDDAVLLHSVSAANLGGLLEVPEPGALGQLWIVLRQAPAAMDLDDATGEPVLSLLQRLAVRFGRSLSLFADTEKLAADYSARTELRVSPVPLPVVVPNRPARAALTLPHVVFPGGARVEKGYGYLPAAVAACAGRARFTIHSGRIGASNDPVVQKAHRALRRMVGTELTLIERPLDLEDYLALLAETDLMLLPYNAQFYGSRSSGILAEALAMGVPAVVPDGCWMAEVAGAARAVLIGRDRSVAVALGEALDRLPELAAAALAAMPAWRTKHNPDALLAALLRGCPAGEGNLKRGVAASISSPPSHPRNLFI